MGHGRGRRSSLMGKDGLDLEATLSMVRPKMNQKLGRGKQPTGTPSLAWSCAVVIVSILAGASVVHNIYKPNLTLPPVEGADGTKVKPPDKK
ncbi:unnamed protein product [Ilex paraguariensis]|uniref:Transmembrane protein n=1 Tax=Ilex paraguariensis TaxID=185542 RepID=A0ABC8QT70_9AQUA